jgi:hypothetical protein
MVNKYMFVPTSLTMRMGFAPVFEFLLFPPSRRKSFDHNHFSFSWLRDSYTTEVITSKISEAAVLVLPTREGEGGCYEVRC